MFLRKGQMLISAIACEETGYGDSKFFEIGHSYANPASQNNILWSFLALDVFKAYEQDLDEAENIEIVLQDFVSFSQQAWSGEIPMQALHLATLGFATQFILRSNLPQLRDIRTQLLQAFSS
jgi:ADP-ribose pyrophosphatase